MRASASEQGTRILLDLESSVSLPRHGLNGNWARGAKEWPFSDYEELLFTGERTWGEGHLLVESLTDVKLGAHMAQKHVDLKSECAGVANSRVLLPF